ncbi:hypothetical protein E2C01_089312 [Portunus trituberculatus]|uniref:Uncharacterized protein n=1 Tax=Portunus trituberculatus TaxID=210409 RepID=A0A5B7JIR1_PORTR|nr:hypothetical protein [Portunus trituberculatus]
MTWSSSGSLKSLWWWTRTSNSHSWTSLRSSRETALRCIPQVGRSVSLPCSDVS